MPQKNKIGIRATSTLHSSTTPLAEGWDWFIRMEQVNLLVISRGGSRLRDCHQTAEEVTHHSHSMFACHGIPEVVVSNNEPQFSPELYAEFGWQYGFEHISSSPYHPQCNGEAERAVKTIKSLLKKSGDHYLALFAYRSTPLECGFTPAQLLMSRNLRTTLPMVWEQRTPRVVNFSELEEKDHLIKERQRQNYDQHHRAKELLL